MAGLQDQLPHPAQAKGKSVGSGRCILKVEGLKARGGLSDVTEYLEVLRRLGLGSGGLG